MQQNYFFQSSRLSFRNWIETDILKMAKINADEKVMYFFPAKQAAEETANFIHRMQIEFSEKGFCYFAVDELKTLNFIGFIGLHWQTFESDFTPCVDIGWRLNKDYWNKGYATEGAKKCLEYAFTQLNLEVIKAVAPAINLRSINVMKKLGMREVKHFNHPALLKNERLRDCILFEITADNFHKH